MKIAGTIPHPFFKTTIFHWNGRYSLKVESGLLEVTFKFREGEGVDRLENVYELVNQDFFQKIQQQFAVLQ